MTNFSIITLVLALHAIDRPHPVQCSLQDERGRDLVDDLARYGTVAVPRETTEFCRRHLHLFDLAFELIHSDDAAVRYSLNRWLGLSTDAPRLGLAA